MVTKNIAIYILLASFFTPSALTYAKEPTVSLSETLVHPNKSLKVEIIRVIPAGKIQVEISNIASGSLRIWQDWNSWGWGRWRIFQLSHGKLSTFYQDQNQIFTKNFPAFTELKPGGHFQFNIDLNGKDWPTAAATKVRFESGDIVIAAYEVPWSKESDEYHVWFGVAAGFIRVR